MIYFRRNKEWKTGEFDHEKVLLFCLSFHRFNFCACIRSHNGEFLHRFYSKFQKSNELMAIEIAAINSNKGMSARQKNSAIRKAKQLIKQRSKDQQDSAFTASKR